MRNSQVHDRLSSGRQTGGEAVARHVNKLTFKKLSMKRAVIRVLLILLWTAVALAAPTKQENRFAVAGLEEREVEEFFGAFKDAVANGDKRRVAAMVDFPARVTIKSGRRVRLANAAALIRVYDQIFYDEFKQLIATTEFKDLWAKSAGVATPRGEVWISGIVKNPKSPDTYVIKIIAINGPIRS